METEDAQKMQILSILADIMLTKLIIVTKRTDVAKHH